MTTKTRKVRKPGKFVWFRLDKEALWFTDRHAMIDHGGDISLPYGLHLLGKDCRRLASYLLKCADYLEAKEKTK